MKCLLVGNTLVFDSKYVFTVVVLREHESNQCEVIGIVDYFVLLQSENFKIHGGSLLDGCDGKDTTCWSTG
jgi:hypothetical protein